MAAPLASPQKVGQSGALERHRSLALRAAESAVVPVAKQSLWGFRPRTVACLDIAQSRSCATIRRCSARSHSRRSTATRARSAHCSRSRAHAGCATPSITPLPPHGRIVHQPPRPQLHLDRSPHQTWTPAKHQLHDGLPRPQEDERWLLPPHLAERRQAVLDEVPALPPLHACGAATTTEDPYRLRVALELVVDHQHAGTQQILEASSLRAALVLMGNTREAPADDSIVVEEDLRGVARRLGLPGAVGQGGNVRTGAARRR